MSDEGIVASLIVFILTLILAGFGVFHFISDSRTFASIKGDCEKRGYVQNNVTRITCQVEK